MEQYSENLQETEFSGTGRKCIPKTNNEEQKAEGFSSNLRIWYNAIIICIAFLFLFTSFQSLSNLQSSLFIEEGMGTNTLAVIYGTLVISCFFVPPAMIEGLGCKWTIAISMLCYIVFMAAHFYATWGLFIPAAIMVGLGAAPLWSAKCTYLTDIAHDYAARNGLSADGAVNLFFGVFFMAFQSAQIWGNVISSTVLAPADTNSTKITPLSEAILATCGVGFCPVNLSTANNTNLDRPSQAKLLLLAGIYTGCAAVAVIIVALFLQQLPSEGRKKRLSCSAKAVSGRLFIATVCHMRDVRQLLLIPLTIFSGLEQGFLASDYTQAFITCPLGNWWIGYVLICYGVIDAVCSFGFGRLVQYIGRLPFFIFGAIINYSLLITFLFFNVTQDRLYIYFLFAGLWGMADAIWQTQINALYGVLFHENSEAGFANYRLWESSGFIAAFVYQSRLCMPQKIYILLGILTLGMTGYFVLEILQRKKAAMANISDR